MPTRTATCSCGQLRIEVDGEPRGVGLCHCLACQRRTGSVFAALAGFAAPYRVVGNATTYVRTGEQGARFHCRFCPTCGTTVFHTEEGHEQRGVSVAVGAFADPGFPPPQVSVYDCRRHPWVQLPDGMIAYDRDPDPAAPVSPSEPSIDRLIARFFAAFDNRAGAQPQLADIADCFTEKAVVVRRSAGATDVYTVAEFALPRIRLLTGGTLREFHEWETGATTQVFDGLATRVSRYAKSGLLDGADYAGTGTKCFQLAQRDDAWLITAFAWVDDPA